MNYSNMYEKRKLKIQSKARRSNSIFERADLPPVPEIRLSGKWLVQAGFEIGSEIEISVKNGKLQIITIG